MPAIADRIVRSTDGNFLAALLDVISSDAASRIESVHITLATSEEINFARASFESPPDSVTALLDKECRVIRSANLKNGKGTAIVSFVRHIYENESELADKLTLNADQFGGTATEFVTFAELVQGRFRSVVSYDLGSLLGPHLKEHYAARDAELNRLQSLVIENHRLIDEQRREAEQALAARRQALEADFLDREKKLANDFEAKVTTLTEREAELEARRKEIDDRSSTHARREDRRTLLDAIKQEGRLKVSDETVGRRKSVVFGYSALLCILVAIVFTTFFVEAGSEAVNSVLLVSRCAATVAAVGTAGFFIKWLNDFAARSTAEDFKLKQLQLDVERASWLVELHFESLAAGERASFPPELLDRLSKNLFTTEEAKPGAVTASDALASALLSSAANMSVDLPGTKLQISKRGIRKLNNIEIQTEDD
jgi:hypothetical protein